MAKLSVERATDEHVRIETPLCLVYTVTELFKPAAGAAAAPLPSEVLAPLAAADIHSISASVDASNLTNLDVGQRTHAFDADTIDGPIIIRTSPRSKSRGPRVARRGVPRSCPSLSSARPRMARKLRRAL